MHFIFDIKRMCTCSAMRYTKCEIYFNAFPFQKITYTQLNQIRAI